ncbi:AraC family transcriptional regulator [Microbacterium foliorum]
MDRRLGPLSCECCKLVLVEEGAGVLATLRSSVEFGAGDVLVLERGSIYEISPLMSMLASVLYIDDVFLGERLGWLLRGDEAPAAEEQSPVPGRVWRVRPSGADARRLFSAFEEMRAGVGVESAFGNVTVQIHKLGLILEALAIAQAASRPIVPSSLHRRRGARTPLLARRVEVARAAQLLQDEMDRRWSLDELARQVNVSPSHLAVLFRTELGIAPMRYLSDVRVQRMAHLLVSSELGVGEIGVHVGWHDGSYAARVFRRRFGVSPTGYRSRMRGE